MLLAEDRLDVLIDRLAEMTPADRRAVLAKLTRGQRARVKASLAAAPAAPPPAMFGPDLAARIADREKTLTVAARGALDRAVARHRPAAAPARMPEAPTSLLGVARRWLTSGA